ncbi:hypothetical protein H9L39_00931 [Fusarium oxysporum f. sp. albedinis]|nr:hypothetical protein H9L39_00931 [Fusarium oxysporum f. sp. albedinis]
MRASRHPLECGNLLISSQQANWISTTLESPLCAALLADECRTGIKIGASNQVSSCAYPLADECETGKTVQLIEL